MPDRPPVYLLEENRRTTRAIHDWAQQWATTQPIQADGEALTLTPRAVGPAGRPVQVVTYPDVDADACRRAVASVLKELMGPGGGVSPRDVVVLTPRSPRSSWLVGAKVGSYRLVSEFGPEGEVLPPPTSAWEVRLSTIHRFKGLESPVVILAEIDGRVQEAQLPGLLYVGATRARTHLVVIGAEGTVP
jgi:superfamily I DNA/RNA helicase